MKILFPIGLFVLWLALSSLLTNTKSGTATQKEYLTNELGIIHNSATLSSSVSAISAPSTGAELNEASIKNFQYGPGLMGGTNEIIYDAKNPPPCSSNCVTAYPKGHSKRTAPNSLSDTQYLYNLVSTLSANGKLYIYPGYYQVDELELKEGIEIIGLYGGSAMESAIFSGFMPLDNWRREGTSNLWSHDYPFSIVNYNNNSSTYVCKDGSNLCKYAQDLFINGTLQTQCECSGGVGCKPMDIDQWFFDRVSLPDEPSNNFLRLRSATDPNAADTRISHMRGAFKDGVKNIKVRNINFKGYTFHSFMTSDNWVVTNCMFEKNGVTGLNLTGDNVTIARNYFKENGCTGLQGTLTRSVIRLNKIENNNVGGHKPGFHSGGMKLTASHNSSVENNYALDNEGAGLWVDAYCNGVEVHHNLLVETKNFKGLQARGIQYEMSSGNRTAGKWEIHNNIVKVEGGIAGIISIYVLNSQYLEVYNNTITNAQNGIVLKQDLRGYTGNCANGYPDCTSCSQVNNDFSCDNYCISGGVFTDDLSDGNCMHQVREIKVYYNDISVAGSGYVLTGLLVEPGIGQTSNEPAGILPGRYYDKSVYKIDFDYNKYTIPGDPSFSYPFRWGWDLNTSKTKILKWEDVNDFVDFNSCINNSCSQTLMLARQSSGQTITPFPNPFYEHLSISTEGFETEILKFKLIDGSGAAYTLPVLATSPTSTRLGTSQIPKGNYVLQVIGNGMVIKSLHVVKEQ